MPGALRPRLVTGARWSLLGRVAVAVTGLGTSVLLTRLVPPAAVGTYLVAVSVVAAGTLLGGLGLNQLVVRLVSVGTGTGRPAAARAALVGTARLTAAGALVVAGAYLAGGGALVGRAVQSPGLGALSLAVALWIAAAAWQAYVTDALRGFGDLRAASLLAGPLQAVLLLVFLVAALVLDARPSLAAVVWAAALSAAVAATVGSVLLGRRALRLPVVGAADSAPAGRLLRDAAPLLLTGVLLLVFAQADLWVVAALLPEATVAEYGIASRVAALVGMPLLIVNGVLPPLVAELFAQDRRAELEHVLRTAAVVAAVPALAAAALFVVAGGPLLGAVYGGPYEQGAPILAVLALGQLFGVVTGSCGVALAMCHRQRDLLTVTAAASAVTTVALVLLTRRFGAHGAAGAAAAGLVLQNALMLLAVRRAVGVWTFASPSAAGALLTTLRHREPRPGPEDLS